MSTRSMINERSMTVKFLASLAVGAMTVGCAGQVAQASWVTPSGGWDVNYDAGSGNLPDSASPAWNFSDYQSSDPNTPPYVQIVSDSVTGEQTLFMDHSASGSTANYDLTSGAGVGSATDEITMDFRFRLLDGSETSDQLFLYVMRDSGPTKYFPFLFSVDDIGYRVGNTNTRYATALGTDWHNVRILIDVAAGTGDLYLDGATTPAFSFANDTGGSPQVQFGDGSGSVQGQVNLSYLRWTNSQMVVPEPGSVALLGLGGLLMAGRRRRGVRCA